jgi:hypothetical protein
MARFLLGNGHIIFATSKQGDILSNIVKFFSEIHLYFGPSCGEFEDRLWTTYRLVTSHKVVPAGSSKARPRSPVAAVRASRSVSLYRKSTYKLVFFPFQGNTTQAGNQG